MSEHLIYMTAPSEEVAESIAKALLEEHVIVCANIIPGVRSLYRWQGNIHDDAEVIVVAKTTEDLVPQLLKRAAECHPYDCPCIISLPIAAGHPPFLEWINAECK